jgi:peptidoglycan/xylan/chitin deacetylase (PgdA/CDA1 family)
MDTMKRKFLFLFFVLFLSNFVFGNEVKINNSKVLVLCYHNINPNFNNPFNMTPQEFEEQMKYLSDHGYKSITSKEFYALKTSTAPINQKYVMITFDDGHKYVYEQAFPIMKKYNFKGVAFLIAICVREKPSKRLLTIEQIKGLMNAGWEIGSHTLTHVNLKTVPLDTAEKEISGSKTRLEKILNIPINTIAYPFGGFNDDVINIIKKYYSMAYTIHKGCNETLNSFYTIDRCMIVNPNSTKQLEKIVVEN